MLVYHLPDVLTAIGINRVQLTVLGIVSTNDYNSNVPSLGAESNFGIIKQLHGEDPTAMVKDYLAHKCVILKNVRNETFAVSLHVFEHYEQTPLNYEPSVSSLQSEFEDLCSTYKLLQQQCIENGKQRRDMLLDKKRELHDDEYSRHKSSQTYNRYRTIDHSPSPSTTAQQIAVVPQPLTVSPPLSVLAQTRKSPTQAKPPCHRPRYSMRVRTRKKQHDLPASMTQYEWKPWKARPELPPVPPTSHKPEKTPKEKDVDGMNKARIISELGWNHPLVALKVGALDTNAGRVTEGEELAEVTKCIRKAIREAADIKRRCLQTIGRFVERLSDPSIFQEADRDLLDLVCPRITGKDKEDAGVEREQEERRNKDDPDSKEDDQQYFLRALAQYLYSSNPVRVKTKAAQRTVAFFRRAADLALLEPYDPKAIGKKMEFPPSVLARNISTQMSVEIKRLYRQGCQELHAKLKSRKDKGLLPSGTCIDIQYDLSTIENFHRLNAMSIELIQVFWSSPLLQRKMQSMLGDGYYACVDVIGWMSTQAPGTILTKFVTDVGLGRQKRRKPGIGKSFNNLKTPSTLEEIKDHLKIVTAIDFNPSNYGKRGYFLLGSIRTNGVCLQMMAYKMKELLSVRYRRLPEAVLPPRITSTIGGVDYYLTEVRNVVKTKQDVLNLWDCEPEQVKILGLDLGQACVVGASALLPEENNPENDTEETPGGKQIFYNLAIKSKAVYQPILKYRRWLEARKRVVPPGVEESISDIESKLPALRGKDGNVEQYVTALNVVKKRLDEFYDGDKSFRKHVWDARKAKEAEFNIITDRLLNMVGGSLGRQRSETDKVVIGIGLGKFSSNSRLTSLHESFQAHFVQR
ncbi:hypothetical protein FBU30_010048, partial [Linnemannia zychae]